MKRNKDANCANCQFSQVDTIGYAEILLCLRYPEARETTSVSVCGEHPDFWQKEPEPKPKGDPTQAEIDAACLFYRHDFGLLRDETKETIRWDAKEWYRTWAKVRP